MLPPVPGHRQHSTCAVNITPVSLVASFLSGSSMAFRYSQNTRKRLQWAPFLPKPSDFSSSWPCQTLKSQWSTPTSLTTDSRLIHCTAPQGSHQLFTSLMEQQCPQSPNPISVFIFCDLWNTDSWSNSPLHFLFPWSSYQAFQTFLQLLLAPLAPPLGPGCGNPGGSGLWALYLCTCLASSPSIRTNPRVPREPRQSLTRMWRKSCQDRFDPRDMLKHKARSADQGGKAMFVAKIMCEKNSLNSQADQMSTCLITPSALTGIVWWLGMRALEAHQILTRPLTSSLTLVML